MISENSQVIYSKACGKVLVAGGYGVLEQGNIGLSFALENYFYCRFQKVQSSSNTTIISVKSPQIQKNYQYSLNPQKNQLTEENSQENVFVENALLYSLKYFDLFEMSGQLKIILTFDKGFISESENALSDSKFITYSENYSKTGLGSSACVVVSIVSAICAFMGHKQNKQLINVISQVANLSAQKKIGSNFDISTAVFGTHLYKNVIPHKAFNLLNDKSWQSLVGINPQIHLLTQLNPLIKTKSKAYIVDISRGANTRIMVSNFLKNLRSESQQTQQKFFKQSKDITQRLFDLFCDKKLSTQETLKKMKEVNIDHRRLQKDYSQITKTPVQPQQFKGFLDELIINENIFYVICPGSGGFDALFMLVSTQQNDYYYDNIVLKANQNNEKQLGSEVQFKLKNVNIKWQGQTDVTKQEIEIIEEFLKLTHSI